MSLLDRIFIGKVIKDFGILEEKSLIIGKIKKSMLLHCGNEQTARSSPRRIARCEWSSGADQQFSVKINPLWYLDSERKRNLFFVKWVLGVQFYNIDISH
jgi:hypothetical protein